MGPADTHGNPAGENQLWPAQPSPCQPGWLPQKGAGAGFHLEVERKGGCQKTPDLLGVAGHVCKWQQVALRLGEGTCVSLCNALFYSQLMFCN